MEEGEVINLVFTLIDHTIGGRINRYTLTREDGVIRIDPKDGGFTTVIAHDRGEEVEKYSEKYNNGRGDYYSETEVFNGKTYSSY